MHAGVHLAAHARAALERLCRYTLRGPLPKGRLEERPDGRLLLHLKKPWSDGSTALIFEPLELLARLAALLPRPGKNGISYHGVLGARAALRAEVVPTPPQTASLGALRKDSAAGHCAPSTSVAAGYRWRALRFRIVGEGTARHRSWRLPWVDLLWRTLSVNSMACPHCGKRMTVRALVLPPASLRVRASLRRSEERSARAPPSTLHAAS